MFPSTQSIAKDSSAFNEVTYNSWMGNSLSCPTLLSSFNEFNAVYFRNDILNELDIFDDGSNGIPTTETMAKYVKKKQSLTPAQYQHMESIVDNYIAENLTKEIKSENICNADLSNNTNSPKMLSRIFDKSKQFKSQQKPLSSSKSVPFAMKRFQLYLKQISTCSPLTLPEPKQMAYSQQSTAISPRRKLNNITENRPTFTSGEVASKCSIYP